MQEQATMVRQAEPDKAVLTQIGLTDEVTKRTAFASPETVTEALKAGDESLKREIGAVDSKDLVKQAAVDPRVKKTAQGIVKNLLDNLGSATEQDRAARSAAVEGIGLDLQKRSAHKSKLLDQTAARMMQSPIGEAVGTSIVNLKVRIDEINPAGYSILEPGSVGRFFTWVPFLPGKARTTLNKFFTKYQSQGSIIDSIFNSLENDKKEMLRDIETLATDRASMRETTRSLARAIAVAQAVDELLESEANGMAEGAEERQFILEELLFPCRQRIQDMQDQLAVNQQGIMAYYIAGQNHKQVIRGIERAQLITRSALTIAVVLATVLTRQRIVLDKLAALDATTDSLMRYTADTLAGQGVEIHKLAVGRRINMETLKYVFGKLEGALNDLSKFRTEALPVMAQSIREVHDLTESTERVIQRIEKGERARPMVLKLDYLDVAEAKA